MLLVWPESAFPLPLTEQPGTLAAIAELLPSDTALVTGAYRVENAAGGAAQTFNTIYVIGADGTILDAYDKVHLVPLGEYLPAAERLQPLGLGQLAPSSFSPGAFRRPLAPPIGPPFMPLICYEIIFPGAVLGEEARPGFLLNLTNDGWFGRTTGPHQHFHQARVRGVEEGLPVVRAANTGISAVTDAYGRIIAASRIGEATALQAGLPTAVESTFYSNWRDSITILLTAVFTALAITKFLYRVPPA
jgi:apolipoprotein N-acyltransferase